MQMPWLRKLRFMTTRQYRDATQLRIYQECMQRCLVRGYRFHSNSDERNNLILQTSGAIIISNDNEILDLGGYSSMRLHQPERGIGWDQLRKKY